ncbi:MAG: DNA internalization-related competence protein ComEC/Rec2 [Planctomycetes bacterium]|nr:DNA internalization-related competence protein ComEC/Rec2 [Planctomycetota bacterium]
MNADRQPDDLPLPPDAGPRPHRPLVAPAVAMGLGILVGHTVGGPSWTYLVAALAALLGLIVFQHRRSLRPRAFVVATMIFWVCLGAGWLRTRTQVGPRDVSRIALPDGRLVTVEGVLLESPRPSRHPDNPLLLQGQDVSTYTGLILRATAVTVDGRRETVDGLLRAIVTQPLPDDIETRPRTGDRMTLIGLLRPLSEPLNPGQVDVREVYASRGIHARLSTKFWEAVTCRRAPPWDPYGWMGWLRARLRRAMPDEEGAAARIIPALLIGDRTGMTDADEQAFIRAGVLHYLAVSGLHVALLSGLLLGLMRLAMAGPRTRAIVLIVFIIVYALATEMRPSVVRAGVFFLLLCCSWLLGRRRDLLNTLAAAAMVVLLLNPADLLQSGFQLSFLVAFALIVVYPRVYARLFPVADWERLKERTRFGRGLWQLKRRLMQMVSVGLTAWAFATPIAASHYHVVAPVGVLGTIVVLPMVFVLLLASAVTAAIGFAAGTSIGAVNSVLEAISQWLGQTIDLLARMPYGHFYVRDFGWPWALMALAIVLTWSQRQRWRIARWQLAAASVVLVAVYICVGIPRGPRHEIRITVLAVGSGNTVLVQAPGSYNLLVDCGSSLLAERTGETVTVPALWKLGVGRLDGVVLTHADADHIKDLPVVLDRIGCRRVFLSRRFLTDEKGYDDRAMNYLEESGRQIVYVQAGDTLPAPPGVTITVLNPPSSLPPAAETNATSVVLKVDYKGRSMILTGDATPDRLAAMAREQSIRCDALLLPHHGEQSDEILEFLKSSSADVAIMSVARFRDTNRRGEFAWPDETALYKTYCDGAVSIFMGDTGVRAERSVMNSP